MKITSLFFFQKNKKSFILIFKKEIFHQKN